MIIEWAEGQTSIGFLEPLAENPETMCELWGRADLIDQKSQPRAQESGTSSWRIPEEPVPQGKAAWGRSLSDQLSAYLFVSEKI